MKRKSKILIMLALILGVLVVIGTVMAYLFKTMYLDPVNDALNF